MKSKNIKFIAIIILLSFIVVSLLVAVFNVDAVGPDENVFVEEEIENIADYLPLIDIDETRSVEDFNRYTNIHWDNIIRLLEDKGPRNTAEVNEVDYNFYTIKWVENNFSNIDVAYKTGIYTELETLQNLGYLSSLDMLVIHVTRATSDGILAEQGVSPESTISDVDESEIIAAEEEVRELIEENESEKTESEAKTQEDIEKLQEVFNNNEVASSQQTLFGLQSFSFPQARGGGSTRTGAALKDMKDVNNFETDSVPLETNKSDKYVKSGKKTITEDKLFRHIKVEIELIPEIIKEEGGGSEYSPLVMLMLDTTKSLTEEGFDSLKRTTQLFTEKLMAENPNTKIGFVGYTDSATILLPGGGSEIVTNANSLAPTTDFALFKKELEKLRQLDGNTNAQRTLYRAKAMMKIDDSMKEADFESMKIRPVIINLTDGFPNAKLTDDYSGRNSFETPSSYESPDGKFYPSERSADTNGSIARWGERRNKTTGHSGHFLGIRVKNTKWGNNDLIKLNRDFWEYSDHMIVDAKKVNVTTPESEGYLEVWRNIAQAEMAFVLESQFAVSQGVYMFAVNYMSEQRMSSVNIIIGSYIDENNKTKNISFSIKENDAKQFVEKSVEMLELSTYKMTNEPIRAGQVTDVMNMAWAKDGYVTTYAKSHSISDMRRYYEEVMGVTPPSAAQKQAAAHFNAWREEYFNPLSFDVGFENHHNQKRVFNASNAMDDNGLYAAYEKIFEIVSGGTGGTGTSYYPVYEVTDNVNPNFRLKGDPNLYTFKVYTVDSVKNKTDITSQSINNISVSTNADGSIKIVWISDEQIPEKRILEYTIWAKDDSDIFPDGAGTYSRYTGGIPAQEKIQVGSKADLRIFKTRADIATNTTLDTGQFAETLSDGTIRNPVISLERLLDGDPLAFDAEGNNLLDFFSDKIYLGGTINKGNGGYGIRWYDSDKAGADLSYPSSNEITDGKQLLPGNDNQAGFDINGDISKRFKVNAIDKTRVTNGEIAYTMQLYDEKAASSGYVTEGVAYVLKELKLVMMEGKLVIVVEDDDGSKNTGIFETRVTKKLAQIVQDTNKSKWYFSALPKPNVPTEKTYDVQIFVQKDDAKFPGNTQEQGLEITAQAYVPYGYEVRVNLNESTPNVKKDSVINTLAVARFIPVAPSASNSNWTLEDVKIVLSVKKTENKFFYDWAWNKDKESTIIYDKEHTDK